MKSYQKKELINNKYIGCKTMKVHSPLFSSESTHLVRFIKSENPDNQLIIRAY